VLLVQYLSSLRHHLQRLRWALHATKRACGGVAWGPVFVACSQPQLAPVPGLLLLLLVGVLSLLRLLLPLLLLLHQPAQLLQVLLWLR
jgi:hypothetical protein